MKYSHDDDDVLDLCRIKINKKRLFIRAILYISHSCSQIISNETLKSIILGFITSKIIVLHGGFPENDLKSDKSEKKMMLRGLTMVTCQRLISHLFWAHDILMISAFQVRLLHSLARCHRLPCPRRDQERSISSKLRYYESSYVCTSFHEPSSIAGKYRLTGFRFMAADLNCWIVCSVGSTATELLPKLQLLSNNDLSFSISNGWSALVCLQLPMMNASHCFLLPCNQ